MTEIARAVLVLIVIVDQRAGANSHLAHDTVRASTR